MNPKPFARRASGSGESATKMALENLAAKPSPAANTAEQVVLGSILQQPEVVEKVVDRLMAEDFFAENHRLLFAEILEIVEDGNIPELELLVERLVGKDLLQKAGGIDYIASLADAAPEPANVAQYAELVAARSAQRQIITVATTAMQSAYLPGKRTPSDLISEATQQLFDVADRNRAKGSGLRNVRHAMSDALGQIDAAFGREDKDAPLGLTTGFTDLDHKTLGMQCGDMIVLAARPAMGKTALCLNIAENAAKTTPDAVALFSMEMGSSQLAMRLIATGARVDATALRTGRIDAEQLDRVVAATGKFMNDANGNPGSSIYIDDTPGLSPMELRARCLRLLRETQKPLGLVIVDYLQLMAGTRANYGNDEVLRISDISSALKKMARELNVPVLVLAQLNRGVEQRVNKRPVMSDIRGSGSIEQDADLILFIYRDEVYDPETADKGIAEILIGKNRNGPVGEVRLLWVADQLRFDNHAYAGNF